MLRSLATSAIALIVGAAPALADITPAQAWENLTKYYESFGYSVATGNIDDAGNTMTVTDATFSFNNNPGETLITIPTITLQETGDAKVRMVLEGDIGISSTVEVPDPAADPFAGDGDTASDDAAPQDPDADEMAGTDDLPETTRIEITGSMTVPGNEMLLSGTPEDMLYEFNYPTMSLEMGVPTDPNTDTTIPVVLEATDVRGTQRNLGSEVSESTFDMTAGSFALSSSGSDPENPDNTFDFRVTLNNMTSSGAGSTPSGHYDLGTQMAEALAAGLKLDGTATFESVEGSFNVEQAETPDGGGQNSNGTFSTGAMEFAFAMANEGMGYKGRAVDSNVEITVADLPFPIRYAIAETSGDVLIPLTAGDEAQPFRLAYTLAGLTLDDAIWNLFDPGNQLPRDPASLTVDLAGDALVTMDLFDPALTNPEVDEYGMPATPPMPLVPQNLTINRVSLDAVGAKADLSGELAFGDNPNEPVGAVEGTFEGINGLLDKAVAMGFLPQDQLMGVRMMMAMFAKPVDGETDKLATQIEFREGGSIFANGQQIK